MRTIATAGGSGSWTFGASNENSPAGTATTITVQLTSVSAGQFVIVGAKHEGATTTMTCSDGTSTLTPLTKLAHSNNDVEACFFYIASSVASGTVTYTITLGATRTSRYAAAMRFSHGATASFDAEATAGGGINTSVTTHTSGTTLTTSGTTDALFGFYTNYSGENPSARQIAGSNADGFVGASSSMWYRIVSGTVSSAAATCTTGASAASVVLAAGFKDQ